MQTRQASSIDRLRHLCVRSHACGPSAADDPRPRLHEGVEKVGAQGAHADYEVGQAGELLPVVRRELLAALCVLFWRGWRGVGVSQRPRTGFDDR